MTRTARKSAPAPTVALTLTNAEAALYLNGTSAEREALYGEVQVRAYLLARELLVTRGFVGAVEVVVPTRGAVWTFFDR